MNNNLIATAFQDLLFALRTWEAKSDLLLDIGIHSPSDPENWFKYLKFEADITTDNLDQYLQGKVTILVKVDDKRHGWNAASQGFVPTKSALEKVCDETMAGAPFDTGEEECEWWKQLSTTPVVIVVLLR
ncbi:unnamed protein product, partial [Clonostachys solani]